MSRPGVDLWIASLDLTPAELERRSEGFPVEVVRRAGSGATREIRGRALAAEILRREILAPYLGAAPAAVRLSTAPSGKPFAPAAPGFHFSVSHSGPILVVAVSRQMRVGVDVERFRTVAHPVEIALRYFSAEDAERVSAARGDLRQRVFLTLWTRTEALLKAMGVGLHDPRPSDRGWWVSSVAPEVEDLCREDAFLAVAGEGAIAPTLHLRTFTAP